MEVWPSVLQFIASSAFVVFCGVHLTRAADRISDLTGLGHLFFGSIFLAGATSLPELFVDLSAIRSNMPNLAVGDLMGSSLFNLLILAIADLMHGGSGRAFSKASMRHALSAAISIGLTAAAALAIFLGPQTKDISVGGIGIGVLVVAGLYLLSIRMIFWDQKALLNTTPERKLEELKGLGRPVAIYLFNALGILIAAVYLAESAGKIADYSGLGRTFIGTTLVAFATSLPELVATTTAVRMGAFDMALGNIFGSNAFNMVLLAPLDVMYRGSLLAAVSSHHILTCLFTILATAVAVSGQLYQVEKRRTLIEPDAIAVILIVFSGLGILYYLTGS